MARFDVYARRDGLGLVLDCQADLVDRLNTRFVVPLLARDEAPKIARRLNPVFTVEGEDYVMVTQFAAAVSVRDLGRRVMALDAESYAITAALDLLICGF